MRSRSHLACWLLLVLALAVLPPLAGGPQPVRARLAADRAALEAALGPGKAAVLLQAAHRTASTLHDAPAAARRRRAAAPSNWSGLDAVARQAERASEALHLQLQVASLRGVLVASSLLALLPLWIAACVDGFALRARKLETLGFQNPAAFSLGLHAAIALAALPLLYLVAPVQVPPLVLPWWSLAAAVPLRFALLHAQPVFTR